MTPTGPGSGADDDAGTDGRSRGQIILVGAVALALVLIGLVVVFNTVLFTDADVPAEPLKSSEQADRVNQQIRNDTRALVGRVHNTTPTLNDGNTGNDSVSASDMETRVFNNITVYANALTNSYGQTGPVYVTVEPVSVSSTGTPTWDYTVQATVVYSSTEYEYENTWTVTVTNTDS